MKLKLLVIVLALGLISGCKSKETVVGERGATGTAGTAGADGKDGKDGTGCSVEETSEGAKVTCGESSVTVKTCDCCDEDFDDNGNEKVSICHVSESGAKKTLKVSEEAAEAHLEEHEGDSEGPCEGDDEDEESDEDSESEDSDDDSDSDDE